SGARSSAVPPKCLLTKSAMFRIHGLTVTRIRRDDASAMRELQQLLERCSDYYALHEGEPPSASAATDEFDTIPPEIPRENIFVLGFREKDHLMAEMSLVRDYPKAGEWWMALFVVDPAYRGRGAGTRICEETFRWIGAGTMVMAVDEKNPRGEKFWRSLGFVETKHSDYTATSGSKRRVIIMRRAMTTAS
ncbi:MAG TPA: GNAT family N-acetyltransferase, partial [Thermoanaerobaculia bacterium]|nr:GNAT family N-acetyltransferase [Thermoanaerobaculia bacterium]